MDAIGNIVRESQYVAASALEMLVKSALVVHDVATGIDPRPLRVCQKMSDTGGGIISWVEAMGDDGEWRPVGYPIGAPRQSRPQENTAQAAGRGDWRRAARLLGVEVDALMEYVMDDAIPSEVYTAGHRAADETPDGSTKTIVCNAIWAAVIADRAFVKREYSRLREQVTEAVAERNAAEARVEMLQRKLETAGNEKQRMRARIANQRRELRQLNRHLRTFWNGVRYSIAAEAQARTELYELRRASATADAGGALEGGAT